MQQRYYDPRVARFWSVDPVTVSSAGGNFNRYWYGNDNPYRFTDPDGRQACSDACMRMRATSNAGIQGTIGEASAPSSNFFRDSYVGKLIGHAIGDPIAAFRSDNANPLTNEILSPGEVRDAKVGMLLLGLPIARGESAAATSLSEAFHYTFQGATSSIERQGLRAGSYATPNGMLSPLQAHIDLALRPNRGLPNALLRIDLNGLRRAGYEIPYPSQVGRSFGMPGGGYEMQFSYPIPPEFIRGIQP
jgi:hypothetical protein